MNLITLKKDENYHALVFLTFFDYFSGFFSFSAFLEDVLYHVSSSKKLTRNRNA